MNCIVAIERRASARDEDRVACFRGTSTWVFALADGAGGTGGGASAAEQVLEEASTLTEYDDESLTGALRRIDARLAVTGGQSTAVIAVISAGMLSGTSCGDSEAWLVTDREVIDLTSNQQRKPLLGGGGTPVSFAPIPFQGTLLLASDGFTKYASRSAMLSIVGGASLPECARQLAELPRLQNGEYQDDVAILLARAEASPLGQPDPLRQAP